MSIVVSKFPTLEKMFEEVFQNETPPPLFIVPSLEVKKDMVEKLAHKLGTIPDQNILRLNEFFISQVKATDPSIQFLDKDLLNLTLKTSLKDGNINTSNYEAGLEKFSPFIDVALDYISIFSPILGREIYREALEELIQNDPMFLKNYGDIYAFLTALWDILLDKKQLLSSWSLGWLFLHLEKLEEKKQQVYIIGFNKLKKVEKEFFEELARTWTIHNVHLGESESKTEIWPVHNSFIHKVVSPMDEVHACLDLIKSSHDHKKINIIAPKTKWFYKNIIELFLEEPVSTEMDDKEWDLDSVEMESFRERLNSFLSPMKVQSGEYTATDLHNLWKWEREQFPSEKEFSKQTQALFEKDKLFEISKKIKTASHEEKSNFIEFLDILVNSNIETHTLDKVLRKLYPLLVQIPTSIRLDVKSWLQFVSLKLEQMPPAIKSQVLNFYTTDEIRWQKGEVNVFLSCTRQDYDRSLFAYLSDYEIHRIKEDLGFDLEGLAPFETFKDELLSYGALQESNHFFVAEVDFMGASQQPSRIVQTLENAGADQNKDNDQDKIEDQGKGKDRYKTADKDKCRDEYKNRNKNKDNKDKGNDIDKDNHKIDGGADVPVAVLKNINVCDIKDYSLKRLSASALQKYINSPHEYFVSYVLGVQEEDPIDVDPSALLRGEILHKALAELIDQEDVSAEKIQNLISEEVQSRYMFWSNSDAAKIQISLYISELKKYLLEDKERKSRTGAKTIAIEKGFEAYFDLEDLKFHKEPKKDRVLFRGAIDRIDLCDDELFIIDYKSGKEANITNNIFSSPQVQMPIYAMIVEDGVLDLPGSLSALIYISIGSQFKEMPALIIAGSDERYMEKKGRWKSKVDKEKFHKVIEEYRLYIKERILDIQNNKFGNWRKNRDGSWELIEVDY